MLAVHNRFLLLSLSCNLFRANRAHSVYTEGAIAIYTSTLVQGVSQRPLTLILLQKHRDTHGRRIVIQIGDVYMTFCQEEGILLQKYRDRNGRCIVILSKVSGSGVDLTLVLDYRLYNMYILVLQSSYSLIDVPLASFRSQSGRGKHEKIRADTKGNMGTSQNGRLKSLPLLVLTRRGRSTGKNQYR